MLARAVDQQEAARASSGPASIRWNLARLQLGAVGSSYSAEAVALRLAMTHLVEQLRTRGIAAGRATVATCMDSWSVLERLRGHPGPEDSTCIARIRVLLRRLSAVAETHLVWVPGHAGVDGNDAVDALRRKRLSSLRTTRPSHSRVPRRASALPLP